MSSGASVPPYVFTQKGTFAAPFKFDVPGSLEVRPDTAHATFDGSGASGDFLACLTFIDADGNVLARQFNPDGVKKGQVMEVTYIPPFGSAATSAAPAPGSAITHEILTALQIPLSAGGIGIPSWAHASGSSLVSLATATAPTPKVAGLYLAQFYAAITTPPSAPGFLAELLLGQATVITGLVATWAGSGGSACVNSVTGLAQMATSDTFESVIFNYNSAGSETFTNLQLKLALLATP